MRSSRITFQGASKIEPDSGVVLNRSRSPHVFQSEGKRSAERGRDRVACLRSAGRAREFAEICGCHTTTCTHRQKDLLIICMAVNCLSVCLSVDVLSRINQLHHACQGPCYMLTTYLSNLWRWRFYILEGE